MSANVSEQVFQIASKFSNHEDLANPAAIENQQIKISDLGIDSLSKLEMVMEIEEALSCDLPEVGLSACQTLGDLINLCKKSLNLQQA